MKAVVLCAGMGTRLGHLTKTIPKPMLPLNGRPLLAYTLNYLMQFDIREIAINVHFFPEQIMDYFKDGYSYGVHLHYSHEEKLLGTAGALINLAPWLAGEQEFLVLYGDVLTDQDISLLVGKHRERQSFATVLLHKRKKSNSVVKMDETGRIVCFEERPSKEERKHALRDNDEAWVNSGVQVLSKRALEYIVQSEAFDLPRDVYCNIFESEQIFGEPLTGFRTAIDSPSRYHEAEQAIKRGDYKFSSNSHPSEIIPTSWEFHGAGRPTPVGSSGPTPVKYAALFSTKNLTGQTGQAQTCTENKKMKHFTDYVTRLHNVLKGHNWEDVYTLAEALYAAWIQENQVFLCGNGGSAANAIHLANDLMYGVSPQNGPGLKVHTLPANQSILTCLANDIDYEHVFSYQLAVLGKPGDILIAFSGSGNSANIVKAIQKAKELGMKTFAFLGYSGGKSLGLVDVAIHFPIDDMQIAEDCQHIVGHMVMRWLAENPVSEREKKWVKE